MAPGPQVALLPDGRRLHLQHGPIDLLIDADGPAPAVRATWRAAEERFRDVLAVLVEELPAMRRPCPETGIALAGPVARRMAVAVTPHARTFVTPMAAVAGSVADEMLAAILAAAPNLDRLHVNNGGDIALWLAAGQSCVSGIAGPPPRLRIIDRVLIGADDGIGGIASSSRHGRSLSLGVADNVTVFARNAAMADVAATLIANAVDTGPHPNVKRRPATDLDPDSDLGARLVTVDVGRLAADDVRQALERGMAQAEQMRAAGLLDAALLMLQDETRQVGHLRRPGGEHGIHPEPLVRGGLRVGVR
ncbi:MULTISPECIES: UPF0280 family protein [unclassified Minwuia]|jgi:uncharacterized protein|uniref:UPF0280 family protein n=1 Tax=unclassified Minwuia TaxID=2618799 RepID=UPI002478816C|nr:MULTISPECIES: UPF0280 family protein [unclassified Minwuia]